MVLNATDPSGPQYGFSLRWNFGIICAKTKKLLKLKIIVAIATELTNSLLNQVLLTRLAIADINEIEF